MGNNLLKSYVQFYISNCFEQEKCTFAAISDRTAFKQQFFSFLTEIVDGQRSIGNSDRNTLFKELLQDKVSLYTNDVNLAISIVKELDTRLSSANLAAKDNKISYLIQQLPQLCWMIDSEGEGQEFNSNWNDYTGIENSFGDKEWLNAIQEDDRVIFEKLWKEKSLKNELFGFEYRIKNSLGEYRWFSLKCIPMFTQDRHYWIGINTDVNELIEAAEKIESINYDLDNFIYIASHDLKAPISNLEGLLHIIEDLLGKKLQEDEILSSVLQMIGESIVKLQATIKDLAHVSKIQRNLSEDIEEVKFSEIIGDVAAEIQSEIKESDATILTELQHAPMVKFSKQDMKSVLSNLISNAIKYKSPERKPEVTITSKKEGGQVVLMVKDNGLGIPSDKKEYIFNMFKRLHDHVEGSGIGLYIVKRIIDNNQGMIEVESEVGQGSVFKVYFPEE